jgi:hypothetical protein
VGKKKSVMGNESQEVDRQTPARLALAKPAFIGSRSIPFPSINSRKPSAEISQSHGFNGYVMAPCGGNLAGDDADHARVV